MTTTHTHAALRDQLAAELSFARTCLNDVLKDVPEDRWVFRVSDADNHILWTLGHLALTDEWVLKMITGKPSPLPENWGGLFGYQSVVQAEASAYPDPAGVRTALDTARARLLAWLETASGEELTGALDDGGVGFASSPAEAIGKNAWHEGWHSGQLSTLRRAMGLTPAFG